MHKLELSTIKRRDSSIIKGIGERFFNLLMAEVVNLQMYAVIGESSSDMLRKL